MFEYDRVILEMVAVIVRSLYIVYDLDICVKSKSDSNEFILQVLLHNDDLLKLLVGKSDLYQHMLIETKVANISKPLACRDLCQVEVSHSQFLIGCCALKKDVKVKQLVW